MNPWGDEGLWCGLRSLVPRPTVGKKKCPRSSDGCAAGSSDKLAPRGLARDGKNKAKLDTTQRPVVGRGACGQVHGLISMLSA